MLQKIRNMWEFASVMQYIYIFGKIVKIDEDFDIEVRISPFRSVTMLAEVAGGVILMIGVADLMVSGL